MTLVSVNIPAIVDRLGNLKAQQADLANEADMYKADLIEFAADSGEKAFEGQKFRASVSFADKRKTDWPAVVDALKAIAGLDPALVDSIVEHHTEIAEDVPCVRVSARKGG
jgi:hypothetical protein